MTIREWLEIVAVVLAWTAPVWLPALAVGWSVGMWCCRNWRSRR
jgi:hypothetical protein